MPAWEEWTILIDMTNETATIDEPMNDDDATAEPEDPAQSFPPPQPPPAAPRVPWWHVRVSRDPTDKKIGGVVSGVARSFGFDVKTTRIAVVISAVIFPALIAVYIAAWALLPHTPAEARSAHEIVS